MRGRGETWRRRGNIVATLLIVIVLLASFYLVTRTYISTETVPLLSIPKGAVVSSIQDVLALAVREWAAQGMTNYSYACNGVYSFSDEDLLAHLKPLIEAKLAALASQQNATFVAGKLENASFRGENGISISLGNNTFVYNDEGIHAESRFQSDYVVTARAKLFHDVVQQWLACDAGNLSLDVANAFGPCYFDKIAPCDKKATVMNQDDWSLIYTYNATEETLAAGVQRSLDMLNKYFAGNSSCGPPLVQEPTSITCAFSLSDVTVTNQYTEFGSTDRPIGDVQEKAAPRVVTEKLYGFSDSELACDTNRSRSPAATPLQNGPYELSVSSLKSLYPGNAIGGPGTGKYAAVASARAAKFTVRVTCSDSRNMLLGLPLEYEFSFRQGVEAACEMPSTMVPDLGGCGGQCGSHPNCPACGALKAGCPTDLCTKAVDALYGGRVSGIDLQRLKQLDCGDCTKATASICCGGMGLSEGIYSKDEWNAACCGALDCNQVMATDTGCFNWKCDASAWNPTGWGDAETSQCVQDKSSVKVGSCGGDKNGCKECQPDGNCAVPQAKVDSKASCGPSLSCQQLYCTADGCTGSVNINEGKPCTFYILDADCADTACKAGVCVSTATGKPCKTTEPCPTSQTGLITLTGTCQGVACIGKQVVSNTCKTPAGLQDCKSQGCGTNGEGQCCGGACTTPC